METIINARSETVFDKSAFEGVGRAVIPVDGWYEWTGEKRRKTAWRIFSGKDGSPLLFAAITDSMATLRAGCASIRLLPSRVRPECRCGAHPSPDGRSAGSR